MLNQIDMIFCAFYQMVMAVFAYIYHQSFVKPQSFSVETIVDQVHSVQHLIRSWLLVFRSWKMSVSGDFTDVIIVVDIDEPCIRGATRTLSEAW